MRHQYYLQAPAFSVENIDIINVARPKGYKHSYRNGRTKHGFIYVVSGAVSNQFMDGGLDAICAHTGELVFIPMGCAYESIYLDEHTELKIVQFDLASGSLPQGLSYPRALDLSNAGNLIDAFFDTRNSNPLYHLACVYNLLWQVDDYIFQPPAKFKRLQPALKRISEQYHLTENICQYAELCDMSEVHFRRLFLEYTGKSPVDYRNDIRLQKARMLLQSREFNVSEVSELCGFSNLSFFIRLYKKKYGYTPKKES